MEKHLRALIVEDAADDIPLLASELRCHCQEAKYHRVETAEEMRGALESKEFDVVLANAGMPHFSAAEALLVFQEKEVDIPFIVVSTGADEGEGVALIKAGAHDYLTKENLRCLGEKLKWEMQEAARREEKRQMEQAILERTLELERRVNELGCMYEVGKLAMEVHSFDALFNGAARALNNTLNPGGGGCGRVRFGDDIFGAEPCYQQGTVITGDVVVGGTIRGGVEICYLDDRLAPAEDAHLVEGIARILSQSVERRETENHNVMAQRMEAVGRMAGGVAHDFNNLLTVIMGNTDCLIESLPIESPLHENLRQIQKSSQSATSLTRRLLAFSRKQPSHSVVLNLNSVVSSMSEMLGRVIGENVRLDVHLGTGLRCIRGDVTQCEQLLMNLALNARDAMPEGGRLTLRTENREILSQQHGTRADLTPGHYAVLSIVDTGKGMDDDTLARIFEPFYTTQVEGGGKGLGLATVYGIVKQSGGAFWISSQVGGGTTFEIYFPTVDENVEMVDPSQSHSLPHLPESACRGRILVAEDEPMVRELTVKILEMNGYRVMEAESGEDALRVFEVWGNSVDLLLTDVVMPGMNGKELASRLRVLQPELRVIFMSGYTEGARLDTNRKAGASKFLQKPFTSSELVSNVEQLLAEKVAARNG